MMMARPSQSPSTIRSPFVGPETTVRIAPVGRVAAVRSSPIISNATVADINRNLFPVSNALFLLLEEKPQSASRLHSESNYPMVPRALPRVGQCEPLLSGLAC